MNTHSSVLFQDLNVLASSFQLKAMTFAHDLLLDPLIQATLQAHSLQASKVVRQCLGNLQTLYLAPCLHNPSVCPLVTRTLQLLGFLQHYSHQH